jgi:pimeloyl-ACP methyl ester carboxylesterase
LLFLHGYGSCKESFYYQTEYFANTFHVVAPDLLGFGKSAKLDSPYGVEEYATWLITFIKEAQLNKPHIIAHSFGARVAIYLLAQQPNLAEKLIITGGAGLVKPRSKEYKRRVALYRRVKKVLPRYAERHFGSEEYKKLSPIERESYKKIVNTDLREEAKKISNPTLLIYGQADRVTPAAEEGAIFHSAISGSILTTISGNHFCFAQSPSVFNALVYSFLNQ